VKLNLGCGLDKRPDFLNIDFRREVKPDLVTDLERLFLRMFIDGVVEHILAKDFLEHLSWRVVEGFLRDCWRVLRSGGKLKIQTPDLERIARQVILNPNYKFGELEGFRAVSFWVYGGQDYKENLHKCGFTQATLKNLLEKVGFNILSIESNGGSNLICIAVKP